MIELDWGTFFPVVASRGPVVTIKLGFPRATISLGDILDGFFETGAVVIFFSEVTFYSYYVVFCVVISAAVLRLWPTPELLIEVVWDDLPPAAMEEALSVVSEESRSR